MSTSGFSIRTDASDLATWVSESANGVFVKESTSLLKKGIWLFFFLWVFEGALRKWILPTFSMPLLVVRDPVALWLIVVALKRGLLKTNVYLFGIATIGIAGFFIALFIGHGSFWTAIYGARTLLLYFPLIFVIGRIFNQDDVVRLGRLMLLIAIPMTILLAFQFYSPQSAWVNRGVGGDEQGAGFGGALGYFRPPGTFSFTNGTTCFYTLVAPFVMFFWINQERINKAILLAASAALVVAIPLSISRGMFLQVAVSVIFLLIAISNKPKYFSKVVSASLVVVMALVFLGNVSFFKTATEAFTARFEGANEFEGGLVKGVLGNRFLGSLLHGLSGSVNNEVFGFGIGSGTPLGAKLLNDDRIALLADFEWIREVGELGLLGLFLILLRVGLSLKMGIASYRKIRTNDFLPWLLMSVGLLIVSQGQLHQPTALGFVSLSGGLWLASLNSTIQDTSK